MIHVDVSTGKGRRAGKIYVQTSVDGGPWADQYIVNVSAFDSLEKAKTEARNIARIFVHGIRFGTENSVRTTAFGYNL